MLPNVQMTVKQAGERKDVVTQPYPLLGTASVVLPTIVNNQSESDGSVTQLSAPLLATGSRHTRPMMNFRRKLDVRNETAAHEQPTVVCVSARNLRKTTKLDRAVTFNGPEAATLVVGS